MFCAFDSGSEGQEGVRGAAAAPGADARDRLRGGDVPAVAVRRPLGAAADVREGRPGKQGDLGGDGEEARQEAIQQDFFGRKTAQSRGRTRVIFA